MNSVKTIGKNIGSLALAQMVSMVSGLGLLIIIARFLGDVEYGKMSFALSFTGILIVFADCGLNVMSIREISRNKDKAGKYLTNTLIIKIILAVFTFCIVFLAINITNYPKDTTYIVILFGISSIISTFSQYLRSIFKAFEKMEYEAILNTIISCTRVGISILVLYLGFGVIEIAYVYVITETLNFILSFCVTVKKFTKPLFDIDIKFCKFLIKEAAPFSMTIFVGVLYLKIDVVMLSMMKGDAVVGWYNAACTIIYSLLIIPNLYIQSIFPLMSKYFKTSEHNLKFTIEKSSKYLFIISLGITLLLVITSDDIVSVIYGDSFTNSALALKILSMYLPLRFVNNVTGYTLASINKEPYHAFGGLVGACMNIVLNLILIPKYSLVGAAIATVITDIVLFLVYYYFVSKFFMRISVSKTFSRPIVSFSAALIVIYFLKINTIIVVIIGIIIYLLMLYITKTFDKDDIGILKNIVSK